MLRRRVHVLGLAALAVVVLLARPATGEARQRGDARGAPADSGGPNVLRIIVIVPTAEAEVTINGVKTAQTGKVRRFVSPALEPAQSYAYELRARWRAGGKDVQQTRTIKFKAGQRLTVDFTKAESAVVVPLPKKTLYDRLGGEAAVKAVVDDVVARAATDPKVNFTRKGTAREWKATPENIAKLKSSLVQMIAAATGGPQKYTGKSMKDVHKGMQISDKEFAALIDDLKAALDKLKVAAKEQDELLAIVASTGKDIVEPVAPKPKPKTLYERLGGEATVKAVVEDFVPRALADAKAIFTRKGTPREWKATPETIAVLKTHLVQIIGTVTGGPQKYSGKGMKEAHKGMQITAAQFDALTADLKASLERAKVPAKEQTELLAIVAGTKKDIVEK